ncbi:uncharacterized protein LOC129581237 [Paramacrobiotus metropolitanus]|uniref:uncharacterized protein LOC129581237 n=1 Tax=Paramacrobiotus metropolitanus TaxID=2943436 RepID=UPI00244648A0|nr:uncharacterized protein LOC129581237 [Paramacrobiotus metropolitanus]
MIKNFLGLKGFHLKRIIGKNPCDGSFCADGRVFDLKKNDQSGVFECSNVSQVLTVSQELLLINYTASNLTGTNSLLDSIFRIDGTAWPEVAAELRRFEDSTEWDVLIPLMRVCCTESAAEHCRRYVTALNENCPNVTQRARAKVTDMHGRWVRKLAYPTEWIHVRWFFALFSSFRSDHSSERWSRADLRELDVSTLSKVAVHILDGCYKDGNGNERN